MLERLSPRGDHRILATDIDDASLTKAMAGGPYRSAEIRNLPGQLVNKYFTSYDDSYWIIDRIRPRVQFRKHNLLRDPFEQGFDLIICPNVVIYFSDQAKRKVNEWFRESLTENGILFIGGTETMLNADKIGFERLCPCFYRKSAGSARDNTRVLTGAVSRT